MTRLRTIARRLLDGFWFVPGAVVLGYVLLAFAMVSIDRAADSDGGGVGFEGGPDAAEGILTTIAGSLITVAGLAFSLTIVVLTLVSSQFTPRALPTLLADRVNQTVAGSFVGLFAYCLLVLRTVRSETVSEPEFVPALSITLAVVLSLVALALLLVFIHHMARSIQLTQIAWRIASETLDALDRLYPGPYSGAEDESAAELARSWHAEAAPRIVRPDRPGYVQRVQPRDLLEAIRAPATRIHIPVRPGDFVTPANAIAAVWSAEASERHCAALREAIPIENDRRLGDDAAYGVRQLTDIALRALSPGVNDPTTAATCIGYVRACVELVAGRAMPPAIQHDPETGSTVAYAHRRFDEIVAEPLAELGRYAADNARVVVLLLDTLEAIAHVCRAAGADERRSVCGRLAERVATQALDAVRTDDDRALIRNARERVRDVCAGHARGTVPP